MLLLFFLISYKIIFNCLIFVHLIDADLYIILYTNNVRTQTTNFYANDKQLNIFHRATNLIHKLFLK